VSERLHPEHRNLELWIILHIDTSEVNTAIDNLRLEPSW
jgi:hypothetical protein